MLRHVPRVLVSVLSAALILGFCTASAEAQSTPRVTGLHRVGQNWQHGTLQVRWKKVPRARYVVRWSTRSSGAGSRVLRTRSTSVKINGLNRSSTYYVMVRAVRRGVRGPWSRLTPVQFTRPRSAVVVASNPGIPGPGQAGPTDLPGWKLQMVENFNGSSLNGTRWSALNQFHMRGRADVSMARNVSLSNGALRLAMTRATSTGSDGQTVPYTSGTVWSKDRMTLPNHFRIQFRIKVPWQDGVWPGSLWFRPNDLSDGEIDPFELFGQHKPTVSQTLHTGGYGGSHVQDARSFSLPDPDAFHTVVVEKTRNLIVFRVDGNETFRLTNASRAWDARALENPNKQWFMWMNLQAGGYGGLPTSKTNLSGDNAAMFVDYIYTWVPAS